MSEDSLPEKSQAVFRWSFDKYDRHDRSTLWYVVAGIVVGGLLVYSIATANILFGVIIFLAVVIVFGRHLQEHEEVACEITGESIIVDGKGYLFHDIATFSIVPTSHGKRILYVHEARGLQHSIPVPIHQEDEDDIREYLENFIEEDIEHVREPIWDHLMRVLKL